MATTASGPNRAAVYVRVSTTKQEDDGTSLDTQEAACRAYAAEHGYVLDGIHFYREVHTGTELWERPQLTALRQAVRAGTVDRIIAYCIDRLARDPVHLGVIVSEATHAGVAVDFVTEPLDDSPEGQLIRFVRGYAAKVEHEKIKERTMRGRKARAEAGKMLPGPRAPYGYIWANDEKSRLAENPETAAIVRRLFREIAAGATGRSMAMRLTSEGVPTPTGKQQWSVWTIGQIIRHPVYTGQTRAFRCHWAKGKNGKRVRHDIPVDEQIVIDAAVPALVTKELADAASLRLARGKSESVRNNHDPEAALLRAGFALCGYCGRAMSAANTGGHGTRYRCNQANRDRYGCPGHTIQAPVLDAAVWSRVAAVLSRPDIIAAEVARLRRDDPTKADIEAVERRLADLTRKERNLMTRLADTDDADVASLISADLSMLARQKRQLREEVSVLAEQRAGWNAAQQRLDDLSEWCRTVAANLGELTYAQRRLALSTLGVEVQVWRADHAPRYAIKMEMPVLSPSSS